MTMAQDLSDLLERGTVAEHAGGERMPQQVCRLGGLVDPGTRQGPAHDVADSRCGTEAAVGRLQTDEQAPGRARRAGVPPIVCQRLPGLARRRQRLAPAALAGDGDEPFVPIEIVQSQSGHFAAAQPQSGQQQQDRVVSPSGRRAPVATGEDLFDLLRRERLRQSGQPPVHDWQHAGGELWRNVPALVEVTQEAAQRRRDELGSGTAQH